MTTSGSVLWLIVRNSPSVKPICSHRKTTTLIQAWKCFLSCQGKNSTCYSCTYFLTEGCSRWMVQCTWKRVMLACTRLTEGWDHQVPTGRWAQRSSIRLQGGDRPLSSLMYSGIAQTIEALLTNLIPFWLWSTLYICYCFDNGGLGELLYNNWK